MVEDEVSPEEVLLLGEGSKASLAKYVGQGWKEETLPPTRDFPFPITVGDFRRYYEGAYGTHSGEDAVHHIDSDGGHAEAGGR